MHPRDYSLIDSNAVLKQCYHIGSDSEPLYDADTGEKINRWQYGAQKFLERYQEALFGDNFDPRFMIVAHDMGHDLRTALFPEYKGKRKAKQRSKVQVEQINHLKNWAKNFFAAIGATQVGVEGVEADDVLAWLCQGIGDRHYKHLYTVDGDLAALANEHTSVYLKLEMVLDEEYQGVPCHLITLYKSIIGDTSDEYPGVKGMGPAAWKDLLEWYDIDGMEQLDQLVANNDYNGMKEAAQACGDKHTRKLIENFATWSTMYKVAKLHPQLCWKPRGNKLTVPKWHKRVPNEQNLRKLLSMIGADDFLDTFLPAMPKMTLVTSDNWADIKDRMLETIKEGDITAFDYESWDPVKLANLREAASDEDFVDALSQKLTGAGFTFGFHLEETIYLCCDHNTDKNLSKYEILDVIAHADEHTTLVAHNFYFEGTVTATNFDDARLSGVHDTQIMQRYEDENVEYGLKAMAQKKLGYKMATYEETVGPDKTMHDLTPEEVFGYGATDPLVTGHLYDLGRLGMMLDGCWDWYEENCVEPTVVMIDSYLNGVEVNWNLQKRIHQDDIETHERCKAELKSLLEKNCTGKDFEGSRNYIEAEKDYVIRATRRKLKDDYLANGKGQPSDDEYRDVVKDALDKFSEEMFTAARYIPYTEDIVMPAFSPTPKQLTAAAEKVGLPGIEKVSLTYLTDYLTEHGVFGFGSEFEPSPEQSELLTALGDAMADDVFRLSTLKSKAEPSVGEDNEPVDPEQKDVDAYCKASDAKDRLGEVVQRIAGVEERRVISGDELNLGSPKQMAKLLYCKLGAPVRLRNKLSEGRMKLGMDRGSGVPSTDEDTVKMAKALDFEEGSWKLEAADLLYKAKAALTRVNLYHNKYPLWAYPDGRIHQTFKICGTDTRRPTGKAPNLLQVSKKDKRMRQMFTAPGKDYVVVSIDFASQEIRLMACESQDPVMLSVYNPEDEKDLHSMTGSGILKMSYDDFVAHLEDPSSEAGPTRQWKAKPVNFGIAYGATPPTLSKTMSVQQEVAGELYDLTMGLYKFIPVWQEKTGKFMQQHGYTLTAFGTKRHAKPDIFSSDRSKVSRQMRQGTNATIQGTAAEMLQKLLTDIHKRDLLGRLRMVFFAPIYDETVAFVHKDDVLEYCREMDVIMRGTTPPNHEIPQIPEFTIGPVWGKGKELGRSPTDEAIAEAVDWAQEVGEELWADKVSAA